MCIQPSCDISNACDQLNYTYIYVKLYIYLLRIKHIFTCISLFVVLIEWSMIYPHALIYMNGEDWAVVGIPSCGKQSKTLKLFLVHIDSFELCCAAPHEQYCQQGHCNLFSCFTSFQFCFEAAAMTC